MAESEREKLDQKIELKMASTLLNGLMVMMNQQDTQESAEVMLQNVQLVLLKKRHRIFLEH